jgi:hypothetical protein
VALRTVFLGELWEKSVRVVGAVVEGITAAAEVVVAAEEEAAEAVGVAEAET